MKIDPLTGCPLGKPGKRRENTGLSTRASALTTPPHSPTRMMPIHSVSTPVSPMDNLKADSAESNVDETIELKTSVSPNATVLTAATTKATRKNAIHI